MILDPASHAADCRRAYRAFSFVAGRPRLFSRNNSHRSRLGRRFSREYDADFRRAQLSRDRSKRSISIAIRPICWVPAKGMFQVALVDFRHDSATYRRAQHDVCRCAPALADPHSAGRRSWLQSDRPGAGHAGLRNRRLYDPQDEGRIAYNDARINYDWELQHK